jgi:hypothetical protein
MSAWETISNKHNSGRLYKKKPAFGGLWNGRKVADWLTEVTGTTISRQRGWESLRQMTFRLRVPRPCHTNSDPLEQEAWKKNLQ